VKPIGLYVRVSSRAGRDDDRFHSPREQIERARAIALSAGYVPGPVFEDIDVSGATPPAQRPGMGRLLQEIAEGRLSGIAAFSLDRLTREPAHGDALVKAVTANGGAILTPDIPDAIDSPTGEFTFGMLLQVAKLYRAQASARFASAKERAIAAGIPVTNRAAVGYRRNAARRYEPDPDVAPVIRELFERRAAGAGPTELGRLLEAHGVTTSQGSGTWSKPAVQSLLKSRTYLGEIRSGPYINPTAHEPIVDEPLWLAAQHPNPAPPRLRKGGCLLTGILRCKACGYSMQGTTSSRGKRIYRCVGRHAGGVCPAPARVYADVVEAKVADEVFRRASLTHTLPGKEGPDLRALEEVLANAERRFAQVMSDEARDALGDLWAADVKTRRMALEQAAEDLGHAQSEPTLTGQDLDLIRHWQDEAGLKALAGDEGGTVVFLDLDLKRRLVASVLPAVAVAKGGALKFNPDLSGMSRRGYNRNPKLNPL
jgi:DNA invertase Pin-like site-specific DNA recombinase